VSEDQVARLTAALDAADRAAPAPSARVALLQLRAAVEQALTVPAMARRSERVRDTAKTLLRQAGRLTTAAEQIGRTGNRRLPRAIIGATGAAADVCVTALQVGVGRAARAATDAAAAITHLATEREYLEPRDQRDRDTLVSQLNKIGNGITADLYDPRLAWTPTQVKQAQDAVRRTIQARREAYLSLRESADSAAWKLYDLAAQARLAKLAPAPLHAIDELLIANAQTHYYGSVLTAASAERAAERFDALSPADAARMEQLLRDAKSPYEQAYLMKALAAGHDVQSVSEFAAKIHPYGDDVNWLGQHLATFHETDPNQPTPLPVLFKDQQWSQGDTPQCVAYSLMAARAQVDPVYALTLTTGDQPGSELDSGAAFHQHLTDEGNRIYEVGHAGSDPSFSGIPEYAVEALADTVVGGGIGVDYDPRIGLPDNRDLLTDISRTVDNGIPVPLILQAGPSLHLMLVTDHQDNMFQIYNPWGNTMWVSTQQFQGGDFGQVQQNPQETIEAYLPRR
jgi:hypothetical protein